MPVIPIAMPMSAFFSAGASFTPSPVIATMSPLRFSESTRRTLSSGVTRAMTPISSIARVELGVGHRVELGAADRPARDAELRRDRRGGDRVVAGDHADTDPGFVRDRDCRFRGRTGRIDDADEREHGQAVEQREQVRRRVEGAGVEVLSPGRKDAQALAREALVLVHVALLERVVGRHDREVLRRGAGSSAREQLVGCTLDEAADDVAAALVVHPVEGRHELVGGVERELGHAGVLMARLDRIEAALLGEHHERALGGIADQLAVLDDRVGDRAIGSRNGVSGTSGGPKTCLIVPSVE